MVLLSFGAGADEVYQVDVLPVLQKHCFGCHGPKKQKGEIRLDQLDSDLVKGKSTETWHDALNMLNLGEMPPEDEPQLSPEERRILVGWLTKELRRAADARRNTGNGVVMRRLNRAEYQNTMTDLLGFEINYSEDLP
ncbi:MAG: c-type cytochrome domain-containing protein, partial [Verrucomicrobiia bacterium]